MDLDWSNESLSKENEVLNKQNKILSDEQKEDLNDLLNIEDEEFNDNEVHRKVFIDEVSTPMAVFKHLSRISSPADDSNRKISFSDTGSPLTLSKLSPSKHEETNGPMKINEIFFNDNRENAFDQIKSFLELSQKSLERNTEKFKKMEKSRVNETELLEKLNGSYAKVEELKKDVEMIEESLKSEIEKEKKITDAIQQESEIISELEEKVSINQSSNSMAKRVLLGLIFIGFLIFLDFILQMILTSHNIKFLSYTDVVNSENPKAFFRKIAENIFNGNWNKMVPS